MNILLAVLYLVHAAHCYGPKLVTETGFDLWPGYTSFFYPGKNVQVNCMLEIEEGALGYPRKQCELRPEYARKKIIQQIGKGSTVETENFQTIVELYCGGLFIDKLKVESIYNNYRASIPDRLVECVTPVVKSVNSNGFPELIKVYYSMSSPTDCPCQYKLYKLNAVYNRYTAQGKLVEVNEENECEKYLKVSTLRYGPKLVDETGFTTWPNYKEYKRSTNGVKVNGKHDLVNPPKEVLLLPQYYVKKYTIGPSGLHLTLRKKYQTKVNLYYGEEWVDELRVSSIETTPDSEIPDGLIDCVNVVVMSVNSEGRPTLLKVYYSMTQPIDVCPCHYQLYERTSDSKSDRRYKPKGDLVKVYNDIECATYLHVR